MARGAGAISIAAALAVAVAIDSPAAASTWSAKLERVEARGTSLVASVTIVDEEGYLPGEVPAGALRLVVAGAEDAGAPEVARFADRGGLIDVALVVEVGAPFAAADPMLRDALAAFVDKLPGDVRVAIVPYAARALGGLELVDVEAARERIAALAIDDSPGEMALADALGGAIRLLRDDVRPGARRIIVVVSDGVVGVAPTDVFPRRDVQGQVNDLATSARGIAIHSVAFSHFDVRQPFRNLGQLARKTHGTFRWAEVAAAIPARLNALAEELRGQLILTYHGAAAKAVGREVAIVCRAELCGRRVDSNRVVAVRRVGGGGGFSVLGWALRIFGGLLLLVAVVVVARALLARRQPPPPQLRLVATRQDGREVAVRVRPGVSIGTGPSNDLVLDDPHVSQRHAFVVRRAGAFFLVDASSRNGLFLGETRVEEAALVPGTRLTVGKTDLEVRQA